MLQTVRSLRNEIVNEWEGKDNPPPYKSENLTKQPVIGETSIFGQAIPLSKYMGFPPTPDAKGDFEQMSLLAGETVGLIQEIQTADEIIKEMIEEAEYIINNRLIKMINPHEIY